jgi:hypothetical protein
VREYKHEWILKQWFAGQFRTIRDNSGQFTSRHILHSVIFPARLFWQARRSQLDYPHLHFIRWWRNLPP